MSTLELDQIYLQLEHEIQTSNIEFVEETRKDARQVISNLKNDIDSWVLELNQRNIACYEMDNLIESKSNQIYLNHLNSNDLSDCELDALKSDIMHIIARSIVDTYLVQLYNNQHLKKEHYKTYFDS